MATMMVLLDFLAHFFNRIGLFEWVSVVPYEYGSNRYELVGSMYIGTILALLVFGIFTDIREGKNG